MQGQPLLSLRILVGATAVTTGVMLLTKAVVDTTIPRPPPKQKGPAKPKKKKSGSLRESLQVRACCWGACWGELVWLVWQGAAEFVQPVQGSVFGADDSLGQGCLDQAGPDSRSCHGLC